jgi:hypothetical protein
MDELITIKEKEISQLRKEVKNVMEEKEKIGKQMQVKM